MTVKKFKGYLTLNWKSGEIKVYKKRPKNVKPFEIPITLDIDVGLPDNPELIARGEIVIPDYKVKDMTMEAI